MTEDPVEQKRLEATAVVASKVSQGVASRAVKRSTLFTYMREMIIVILVIAVALLVQRNFTEGERTKNAIDRNQQRSCSSLHKFGLITPQKTTTDVGLQILAQNRNDFYLDACDAIYGRLPAPDSRMRPYLIQAAQH